jgi:hypothetical protein
VRHRDHAPRAVAFLASLISVIGTSGCGPGRCAEYRFTLPATNAFYDASGEPGLKHPPTAYEECGDFGTQGNWSLGLISFEPAGGRSAATFADMLLSVTFDPTRVTSGTTLENRPAVVGRAFTGLGLTTRDEAFIVDPSSLTFHSVGEVLVEDVFDRRVIDVSFDLTWEGANGARYEAKGRDVMDMYVDK